MRRLYVLRHAKSDWTTNAGDHARPLNERGLRSAEAIGRVLGEANEEPALIVSSTATRALATAELVVEAAGWDVPLVTTDDLYHTSVAGALEVIGREGGAHDSLMIVGHQPGWSALVGHLSGARIEMKTATVVALDTYGAWPALGERSCSIGFVIHPRMFMGGRPA